MKIYPLADQNQQNQCKLQHKLKQQRQQGLLQHHQQHKGKQQKQHKVCKKETDVALAVGRAAWWTPVLAANSNMRDLTFAEAFVDFLQNCSFHCYGKLVETGRRYQERLLWFVIHMVALSTLITILWNNRNEGGPILRTTLHDPLYHICNVQFPAVSVCSINRISNASATRYAEELSRKDPSQRGVQFFYEQIKFLQYHYYMQNNFYEFDKALSFQRFLDIYDREDTEMFYGTRKRMAMLTPNCSDILLHCRLGGEDINCAEEFEEKFTSKGLCCTFNNNNKYPTACSFHKTFLGENMDLTLLLSAPQKDNFYKLFDLDGFIINIHSPSLQPDHLSGGLEENFALTGVKTIFALTARIHSTVNEARFLSPKVRNCLFSDEVPGLFGSDYSFNNCITFCRIRSIYILCGCLPFQTPIENLTFSVGEEFCNLNHQACLTRYEFKWTNVITKRENIRGLEREMEDSLYCPDCLPSCSETRYSMNVMGLALNKYTMKSFRDYQQNYSDLALVNIFFAETKALFFKRILINSWFEIFSYCGNICGIITGFSLIGICELIFFVIEQIVKACKKDAQFGEHGRTNRNRNLNILP